MTKSQIPLAILKKRHQKLGAIITARENSMSHHSVEKDDKQQKVARNYIERSEMAYKTGRKALIDGRLQMARVKAVEVRELAFKAQRKGLSKKEYDRAIHASDALLNAFHREYAKKYPK